MKFKNGKKIGSIALAAILGVSGMAGFGTVAFAEEESEALTEEVLSEPAAEPTELTLDLNGEAKTVMNYAGPDFDGAGLSLEEAAFEEDETETGGESASAAGMIVLTQTDGTERTFEVEDTDELEALSNLQLEEKIGFLFLSGTNADGEEKYYYEDAEDVTLDEPVTMYTVGMVNIREDSNGDSELVGTAERGSEVEVNGGTSSWFFITQGDLSGYIAARYLTMDPAEAEAAVAAEENARAAAEAAAAAAAAAEAAASYSSGGGDYSGGSYSGGSDYSAASSSDSSAASDDACLTGGVLN